MYKGMAIDKPLLLQAENIARLEKNIKPLENIAATKTKDVKIKLCSYIEHEFCTTGKKIKEKNIQVYKLINSSTGKYNMFSNGWGHDLHKDNSISIGLLEALVFQRTFRLSSSLLASLRLRKG